MEYAKKHFNLKIFILATFISITLSLAGYKFYKINKELETTISSYDAAIKQNENSNRVIDSLANEVFIFKTNQERYEVAIDIFKNENPAAHKQLENILYNKTE